MLTWHCRKCFDKPCKSIVSSVFILPAFSSAKYSKRAERFITVCFSGRARLRRGQRGEGEFELLQNYSIKMKHLFAVQTQILSLGSQTHLSSSVLVRARRVPCAQRMVVLSSLRICSWRGQKGNKKLDRRESRWVMLFLRAAAYLRTLVGRNWHRCIESESYYTSCTTVFIYMRILLCNVFFPNIFIFYSFFIIFIIYIFFINIFVFFFLSQGSQGQIGLPGLKGEKVCFAENNFVLIMLFWWPFNVPYKAMYK